MAIAGDLSTIVGGAAQQQKLAEQLRNRALNSKGPEGEMVSGHYVAPHWSAQLGPLANALASAYTGYKADQATGEANAALTQAREKWMNTFPMGTPEQTEVNPIKDDMGQQMPNAVTPPKPVALPQMMQHYMAGQFPGNEKAAEMYLNTGLKDLEREDKQVAARDLKDVALMQAREKMRSDAEAKARADEEKATQNVRHDDTLRFLGGLTRASAQERNAILESNAGVRAGAAQDKADLKAHQIPNTIDKPMKALQEKTGVMDEKASTFKPEFGGIGGGVSTWAADNIPGVKTEAGEWWRNYRHDAQLAERVAVTGKSMTTGEANIWKQADINPSMSPDVIARNLEKRAIITKLGYIRKLAETERMGYKAHEVYNEDPTALQQQYAQLQARLTQLNSTRSAAGKIGGVPAPTSPPASNGWSLVK